MNSESTDHNNNQASNGPVNLRPSINQMPIDRFYKPQAGTDLVNNENTNYSAGSKQGGAKKKRDKSTGKRTADKKLISSPQLQGTGSGGASRGKLSGTHSGP